MVRLCRSEVRPGFERDLQPLRLRQKGTLQCRSLTARPPFKLASTYDSGISKISSQCESNATLAHMAFQSRLDVLSPL